MPTDAGPRAAGSPGAVRLARNGAVATITVDRPEARNALTTSMKRELVQCCTEIGADGSVRAVVLRGTGGRSFVSGADINELETIDTVAGMMEQARLVDELYDAIEAIPQPTIAAIDGFALGSGMFLALACDLRVCTTEARLGVPAAAKLGNCLSQGEYTRLMEAVGALRARELLIGAHVLSADHAHRIGLVTEVVPVDDFSRHVDEVANRLASHAPLSIRAAKESIRRLSRDRRAGDEVTGIDTIIADVLGSSDFEEGRRAFREKRAPVWRNA